MDTDPPLPRPHPSRRPSELAGAWLTWFGVGRLIAAAVSVTVVVAGAFWLVRSPAPPTEAGLPVASLPSSSAPTLPPPVTTATVPATVVVHVAGAVRRPGVYELPGTARIEAAIDAAAGPTTAAELDALNLAAPVADGQRIYVPRRGDVDPATFVPDPGSADAPGDAPSGPVDLNMAAAGELETLPGVGPATAAAIVDDRTRNGPFASVDDLERVPGIGPAKLAALRDLVTV